MSNMTDLELPEYLPEEEIHEIVSALRGADLKTVDFEWLKRQVMRLSKGLVLSAPIHGPPLTLHRARSFQSLPEEVNDLSYPPSVRLATYGRANSPGSPIFYLNTLRNAVFFEVKAELGHFLAIGRWEVTDKLMMVPVGYSQGLFVKTRSNRSVPVLTREKHPQEQHPTNKVLTDFLSEVFMKDVSSNAPWEFKISAAIAENFLSCEEADGIMYPTVAMRANSDNFALRPVATRKLRLTKVEWVRIDAKEDFSFKATVLNTATEFPDGRIAWKGKPKWVIEPGETGLVVVENGQYRLYDSRGNRREYD